MKMKENNRFVHDDVKGTFQLVVRWSWIFFFFFYKFHSSKSFKGDAFFLILVFFFFSSHKRNHENIVKWHWKIFYMFRSCPEYGSGFTCVLAPSIDIYGNFSVSFSRWSRGLIGEITKVTGSRERHQSREINYAHGILYRSRILLCSFIPTVRNRKGRIDTIFIESQW